MRPSYFEGQYLGAEDLAAAVDYERLSAARHALSRMKSVSDLWATSAARRSTTSCSGVARSPSRAERPEGDDATAVMAAPLGLDQSPQC